jgi:flagellar P-ring protein precursor FlgI
MKRTHIVFATIIFQLFFSGELFAQKGVRIKDVAAITGLEDVQLYGYGLVVGLAGTGDKNQTLFTVQTVRNMLKNLGVELPDKEVRVRNVASVMVTSTLTPFKRKGTKIDVVVSSMGDATSLGGGTLILTPLEGPDREWYASAQGSITTGGYDVNNRGANRVQKNHTLVGRIPDGAIIQKEYRFNVLKGNDLSLSLYMPDFTSAISMSKAINDHFVDNNRRNQVARALDASTIELGYSSLIRDSIKNFIDLIDFISQVENITFDVAMPARIVMNERTGTIVAGGNVRISEIAVTHGGVKIEIVNIPEVVQPLPFTLGSTALNIKPETVVEEKDMDMVVLNGTTTVSDLAQALNSLGVAPRDIIAIFQAIKEAGALQGQLIIM